jgi:hypothetical protein
VAGSTVTMSNPLSPAEAKELIRLCESGRLYEVEAWIRAGRSLTVPKEVRKAPLNVAMSSGFHSLVELLLRHEPRQEAKNDALAQAHEAAAEHGSSTAVHATVPCFNACNARRAVLRMSRISWPVVRIARFLHLISNRW